MPKNSLNVSLKGADDIFSTEESRQEQQREQVQQIPIGELFPFKNHPFKVLDDESMQRTVESVEQYGVLSPLIARPRPEGGYEIISGHRRQHAAQLAGLDALPVIVRNMDDDAAVLLMVDSNLQRENILPSERAFAYKMKLEALKNQGARSDLLMPMFPLSIEAFTESYRGWCKRKNYKFRTDTAHKIYLLAQEGVATFPKCESTKMLITQACKSLNAVCEAKQSTQLEMQRLAAMLPEYEVVMQMEGAGPITGPALMAEIGDVRRFKNKKALVAFSGIDAPPFQSGAFESKSRHVSKRGSPHLRRTIFIVSNIILTRSNPENAVYCFMDKKRSEGKHYYVYTVAGSAKFLRVYYARVTEFLRSQPSPDAC